VILERAPDEADAVRHQRRGQRVAGIAGELQVVEAEAERKAAVDQPAGDEP
jgi:hypothetical protein